MVAELVEIELNTHKNKGLNGLPGKSVHTPLRLGLTVTDTATPTAGGGWRADALGGKPAWGVSGDQYPVITTNPDAQVNLVQYQKGWCGIEVVPRPGRAGDWP